MNKKVMIEWLDDVEYLTGDMLINNSIKIIYTLLNRIKKEIKK